MEKIGCVVVTYNRLALLKECIAALQGQSYPLHKIYIINNCSTDGTEEYLSSLSCDDVLVAINLPENVGGAGGFYAGVKRAVLDGCEGVWLMDDDTIPARDALKELAVVMKDFDHVGFVCSKVVWTDGELHLMNIPGVKEYSPEAYMKKQVRLCNVCTFVSVLINARAVYDVGLPIAEFFIWHDDTEYTDRITSNGWIGLYAERSVSVHKTPVNYGSSITTAPDSAAWKFYYQARNTVAINRKRKGAFRNWFSAMNKLRIYKRRISKRAGDKKPFIDAVRRGVKDGLKFYPEIEYLPKKGL